MTPKRKAALTALLERVAAGEAIGSAPNDDQRKLLWNCFPTATPPVSDAAHHARFAWGGSLDAAKSLIAAVCIGEHQVTADWGPSGCGAKLVWWPDGLSDGREIASQGYDIDPARAMLGAVIRALIADTEGR